MMTSGIVGDNFIVSYPN